MIDKQKEMMVLGLLTVARGLMKQIGSVQKSIVEILECEEIEDDCGHISDVIFGEEDCHPKELINRIEESKKRYKLKS